MPEDVVARVHVDPERCQGHARCYSLAPELFDCDDNGFAFTKNDGAVSAGQRERAMLAVNNCPEYAITLEDA